MDKVEEKWMTFKCPECGCAEWARTGRCVTVSPCDSIAVTTVNGRVDTYDVTYHGYTDTLYDTLSNEKYRCAACDKEWETIEDMVKDGAFEEVKY